MKKFIILLFTFMLFTVPVFTSKEFTPLQEEKIFLLKTGFDSNVFKPLTEKSFEEWKTMTSKKNFLESKKLFKELLKEFKIKNYSFIGSNLFKAKIDSETEKRLKEKGIILTGLPDKNRIKAQLNVSVPSIKSRQWMPFFDENSWVDIAVVDSGINFSHPFLEKDLNGKKRFFLSANFSSDENADDFDGHGTHVAGIIASSDKNFQGVFPFAQSIMNAKFLNSKGIGSDFGAVSAWSWAVEDNNDRAEVLNNSWGCSFFYCTSNGTDPLTVIADKLSEFFNAVFVFSAGNTGFYGDYTIGVPADSFNGITVGSMNDNDTIDRNDDFLSYFSSRGPTRDERKKPDVVAPGTNITSLNNKWKKNLYSTLKGTSMAAPHVSGAAAILINNGLTALETKALIINSAKNPDKNKWSSSLGWGYIDLNNALTQHKNVFLKGVLPGEISVFKVVSDKNREIKATISWYRHADYYNTEKKGLNNLDLYLFSEKSNELKDFSISSRDNVEQVKSSIDENAVILVHANDKNFVQGFKKEIFGFSSNLYAEQELFPDLNFFIEFPTIIFQKKSFDFNIVLKNDFNIALHNINLEVFSKDVNLSKKKFKILFLPAKSHKKIGLTGISDKNSFKIFLDANSFSYLVRNSKQKEFQANTVFVPDLNVYFVKDKNFYSGNQGFAFISNNSYWPFSKAIITSDKNFFVEKKWGENSDKNNFQKIDLNTFLLEDGNHSINFLFVFSNKFFDKNFLVKIDVNIDNHNPVISGFKDKNFFSEKNFFDLNVLDAFFKKIELKYFPKKAKNSKFFEKTVLPECKKIYGFNKCVFDLNLGIFDENTYFEYFFIALDLAGNTSRLPKDKNFSGITDFFPPVTTIDANNFTSHKTVFLTSTDKISGTKKTFYSFDGNNFVEGNKAILLNEDNNVFFYSVDFAGNTEKVKQKSIVLDENKPVFLDYNVTELKDKNSVDINALILEKNFLNAKIKITDLNNEVLFEAIPEYNDYNNQVFIHKKISFLNFLWTPIILSTSVTDKAYNKETIKKEFIFGEKNTFFREIDQNFFKVDLNNVLIDLNYAGKAKIVVLRNAKKKANLFGFKDKNIFLTVFQDKNAVSNLLSARIKMFIPDFNSNKKQDYNSFAIFKFSNDKNRWVHPRKWAVSYGIDLNKGLAWTDTNAFSVFALGFDNTPPFINSFFISNQNPVKGETIVFTAKEKNLETGLNAFLEIGEGVKQQLIEKNKGEYSVSIKSENLGVGRHTATVFLFDDSNNYSSKQLLFELREQQSKQNNVVSSSGGGSGGGGGGGSPKKNTSKKNQSKTTTKTMESDLNNEKKIKQKPEKLIEKTRETKDKKETETIKTYSIKTPFYKEKPGWVADGYLPKKISLTLKIKTKIVQSKYLHTLSIQGKTREKGLILVKTPFLEKNFKVNNSFSIEYSFYAEKKVFPEIYFLAIQKVAETKTNSTKSNKKTKSIKKQEAGKITGFALLSNQHVSQSIVLIALIFFGLMAILKFKAINVR